MTLIYLIPLRERGAKPLLDTLGGRLLAKGIKRGEAPLAGRVKERRSLSYITKIPFPLLRGRG